MNFKEMLRMAYGLFMGTSTPYLKPTKRFQWPISKVDLSENACVFTGGTGNAVLVWSREGEAIVVNPGSISTWAAVQEEMQSRNLKLRSILLTQLNRDFAGSLDLWPISEAEILIPNVGTDAALRFFGERPPHLKLVRDLVESVLGDLRIQLVPVGGVATSADLLIRIPQLQVSVLGLLYFNRIHPIFHMQGSVRVREWTTLLQNEVETRETYRFIPAEGDIEAGADAVESFSSYLRDLADPNLDFQIGYAKYPWREIPSYTSFAENFDRIRRNQKSHTTLQS